MNDSLPRTFLEPATFSPCRTWRYVLRRDTGNSPAGRPPSVLMSHSSVAFIGLNPSTADERINDPTVRRCIGYARDWGYDEMVMLNIFAFRSTDPKALYQVPDPIGPLNDEHLIREARHADLVVCAWGVRGAFVPPPSAYPPNMLMLALCPRGELVRRLLDRVGVEPYALGLTKGGHPKHTLYLPKNLKPTPWR